MTETTITSDLITPDPVQAVRPFRHPWIKGTYVHEDCGRTFHDHGWIDHGDHGYTVCPWDWPDPQPIDPAEPFRIEDTCCGQCAGGCYVDGVTGA